MQKLRANQCLAPIQSLNLLPKFRPRMPKHCHSAFTSVMCFIFRFFYLFWVSILALLHQVGTFAHCTSRQCHCTWLALCILSLASGWQCQLVDFVVVEASHFLHFLNPSSLPLFCTKWLLSSITNPVHAFKILKLVLELFLLCFSFIPFLVCLPFFSLVPFVVFMSFLCIFLIVSCSLHCLLHFGFCLKHFFVYIMSYALFTLACIFTCFVMTLHV